MPKPKKPVTMPTEIFVIKEPYRGLQIVSSLDDLPDKVVAGIYKLTGIKRMRVRHELEDVEIGEVNSA